MSKKKINAHNLEKEIIDLNNMIYEIRERQFQIIGTYEEISKIMDKVKMISDSFKNTRVIKSSNDERLEK